VTDQAYAANPVEYVVRRLKTVLGISPDAERALAEAIVMRPPLSAREVVKSASGAQFLLRGLACRSRTLPDGRQQVTAYVVPGDLCNHSFLAGGASTAAMSTLVPSVIAEIPMPDFLALCDDHPDVMRALLKTIAHEDAMIEERVVSLGVRTALERLGHLFCEMYQRLDAVGLVRNQGYEFRVTQSEMGHGLGMSAVHVNRTLQRLRREKFVFTREGRISSLDWAGLRDMAGYDPAYLG
jgi:CRP-like cAMP-binding protein